MRRAGEPLERRDVYVDGRRIRYGVAGQGRPVVLVHGLSASSRWWDRNVPALAERHRVYAVDLPGFGENRAPGLLALDAMAVWLLRWLEAIGIGRCHLVGHSMGGFVAINLAVMAPDRVDRLVLVDPVVRPFVHPYVGPLQGLLAELRHTPRAFLPVLARDFARAGAWTVQRAAHAVVRADARPRLAEIQAPTLVIWGEHDALVPMVTAQEVVGAIPDARLVTLPSAGHTPMWDRAEEFNRVVSEFLREGQAEASREEDEQDGP
ncbi:MAG: alpha/beta fold hydrolase [Chloroflexota bacterium]|nr:alpha/beta fold hydrolase [Chloroflexota bacterium]